METAAAQVAEGDFGDDLPRVLHACGFSALELPSFQDGPLSSCEASVSSIRWAIAGGEAEGTAGGESASFRGLDVPYEVGAWGAKRLAIGMSRWLLDAFALRQQAFWARSEVEKHGTDAEKVVMCAKVLKTPSSRLGTSNSSRSSLSVGDIGRGARPTTGL